MKRSIRILSLFTGSGKTALLDDMQKGLFPRTVIYQLKEEAPAHVSVTYKDTESPYIRALLGSVLGARAVRFLSAPFVFLEALRYDVLITSDTGPAECLASLVYKISGGHIGPAWYFITVNSSVLIEKTKTDAQKRKKLLWSWDLAHRIICLTNFQKKDLVGVGISPEKIQILPLGVDDTFFLRQRDDSSEEYIFSVGNDRARDYNLLLKIAPHIPHPIVIATSRKNIPEDTVLPKNVTVTYGLPINEVREHYKHARMLIVPIKQELDMEGSDCSGQTVVLEALSAGMPVMVTPCPWVIEYIEDEKDYFALPINTEEAAEKIVSVWNDSAYLQELSEHGSTTVRSKYTVALFAKALLAQIQTDAQKD